MAEIRYLLDETIETELQNLKSFNGDGKERSAAIDDIVALYKLHIDEIKTEVDAEEKRERRSMERTRQENERADHDREEAYKQRQLKEQSIDRYVKVGIAAAELIAPLIFYAVCLRRPDPLVRQPSEICSIGSSRLQKVDLASKRWGSCEKHGLFVFRRLCRVLYGEKAKSSFCLSTKNRKCCMIRYGHDRISWR